MEFADELMIKGIIVGVFQENCWIIGNKNSMSCSIEFKVLSYKFLTQFKYTNNIV